MMKTILCLNSISEMITKGFYETWEIQEIIEF
jgi:hypothetical protein